MTSNADRDKGDRAKLEEMGIDGVRIALLTNANIPLQDRGVAWRWLRDKEDARRAIEAKLANRMLTLTIIAAVAGTIAAVASVWALFR